MYDKKKIGEKTFFHAFKNIDFYIYLPNYLVETRYNGDERAYHNNAF